MNEDYPIDIHYNKLLDWLISRRHCDPKWHVHSKELRNRVVLAVKGLPQEDVKLAEILMDKDKLTYFDCKDVLDALKEVDGDAKSLFGQYTAPRVKEWADILKAYERSNVCLAECGQYLARLVNYEIPTVKQQISRSKQTIRDCLRQEEELRTNAATFKEKYEASCAEMGIKGVNVKAELSQLLNELPEVYTCVLQVLPALLPVITFYQTFLQSIGSMINEDAFLPMLSYVLKNGNVTVYQWQHGEPPISDPNQNVVTSVNGRVPEEELSIDWGAGLGGPDTMATQDDGIDFGDMDTIDFGDALVGKEEEEGVAFITLEESGVGGMVLEEEGLGGVAQQPEATKEKKEYSATELQLLLENPMTRNLFLDDLMELKAFFSHRLHELTSDTNSAIQLLSAEQFGMQSNSEDMADMLGHVTTVLDHMTNKKVQHLFLMKGSQRYLQRLSEKLLYNLRLSNKASSQCLGIAAKREQASTTVDQLQPQFALLVARTKHLQTQMAGEISGRYKNRTVNIMGEINQI